MPLQNMEEAVPRKLSQDAVASKCEGQQYKISFCRYPKDVGDVVQLFSLKYRIIDWVLRGRLNEIDVAQLSLKSTRRCSLASCTVSNFTSAGGASQGLARETTWSLPLPDAKTIVLLSPKNQRKIEIIRIFFSLTSKN